MKLRTIVTWQIIVAAFWLLIGCATLCPAADPATRPAAEPEPFFPLMAWNHVPNDPAALRRMRECGLTVAGFAPPEALDACRAAGLKAIVSDPRISTHDWRAAAPAAALAKAAEAVDAVRCHPAVLGYYLRDEPGADLFPGLAAVAGVVREHHPAAWPYINLFPNYATPGQLAAPTYEAYLEKFVEACRPPVLSYDHYALHEGGRFTEAYFTNLEQVRRVAAKHKLPFWNIVQAEACLNFREPTAVDFRFQVYTSLAYGAGGIAYFQYFGEPSGNFRGAPVEPFGNETPAWGWMRQVNLQVGKLAPTLLKLRHDRAYHLKHVPPGCGGPDEQSLVASAAAGDLLVGDFTHADGTRYALCVNTDFAASVPCQPRFREAVKRTEAVSPYTGQLIAFAGEGVWLAPGQGVLLKLTR
ncbi:MAG: hypothetical protein JWO31_4194 [Phycisphaerales bacterium]|nr:hypothetical protein [Phycisphaerales bacterium]